VLVNVREALRRAVEADALAGDDLKVSLGARPALATVDVAVVDADGKRTVR